MASVPVDMIQRKSSLSLAAAFLGLAFAAPALCAQAPVAPTAAATAPTSFDYKLGSQTKDGATYTVESTQPVDSKLKSQRVKFTSVVPTGSGTTTRYFIINTGKYKTVGELGAYLRDVFGKFLGGAPANAEVGKVGDIKYGGEIRFVVESPDVLRYDTMTAGEPNSSMTLPASEIKAYTSILTVK